jgi:hypothetical protein
MEGECSPPYCAIVTIAGIATYSSNWSSRVTWTCGMLLFVGRIKSGVSELASKRP